jgi:hypothetical protein
MPPKAPVPIRARPVRDSPSLGNNDQPGAIPAGAVVGQQGSQVARPTPTQDTAVQPSGTIQGGGPTTINTSTLTPIEPKGKGRATSSVASDRSHGRKRSQQGSRTSQAASPTGPTRGDEIAPALIAQINRLLDARLGPTDRNRTSYPTDTNDRPYTAPTFKREPSISSGRSSTAPSVKREAASLPPTKKKATLSKHRFTSADSDDENRLDGDINVRFKLIEFFGKTDVKNEVERFIANNELVFDLKRQQFRSDTQKINFMATLFRDEAQEWYEPYQGMERLDKPDWCLKYSLFVKELLDEFGDPKPLESASDRILTCKMKPTQDVRQYYREFSGISVKLKDWGDASFARLFFQGLAPEIQVLISNANNDFPTTLKGMRNVAVQAYRRQESLHKEPKELRDGRHRSTRVDSDTTLPRGVYNVTP